MKALRVLANTIAAVVLALPFSAARAENAPELSRPFVYEVRFPGSTQVSYLFGSMHYGFGTSELPSWVQRLHHDAQLNIYELEVDGMTDFFMLQDFYFNPQKAAREMGINNSKETVAQLIAAGIAPNNAPYFPASWPCELAMHVKVFGLSHPWRELDAEFEVESKLLGKEIHYLDTEEIREAADKQPGVQLEPVCMMPDLIKDSVKAKAYFAAQENLIEKQRAIYRSGDEAAIDPTESDPAYVYRNHAWTPQLTPVLKTRKAFVTVGATHLFGNEGLIRLLTAEGFQIRRVLDDPRLGGQFAHSNGVGF